MHVTYFSTLEAAIRRDEEEASDVVSEKLRKYRKRKKASWYRKHRFLGALFAVALLSLTYLNARSSSIGVPQPGLKAPPPAVAVEEPVKLQGLSSLRGGAQPEGMSKTDSSGGAEEIAAIKYEVYGKVQGVFFRKYTKRTADELGVVGWVMNTAKGTVTGEAQGSPEQIAAMENWLETKGSPKSSIERLVVTQRRALPSLTYSGFSIRK